MHARDGRCRRPPRTRLPPHSTPPSPLWLCAWLLRPPPPLPPGSVAGCCGLPCGPCQLLGYSPPQQPPPTPPHPLQQPHASPLRARSPWGLKTSRIPTSFLSGVGDRIPASGPVAPPACLREHVRAHERKHARHVPLQPYRPTVHAADGHHRRPPRTCSMVTVTNSHTVTVAPSAASPIPSCTSPHVGALA